MTEVVIVTHAGLAQAFQAVAETIVGDAGRLTPFSVESGEACDDAQARLARCLRAAAGRGPVLVLTDLPGATPHNIAVAVAGAMEPAVPVVAGLNLPMLLRALNHAGRPCAELAGLAAAGGRRGVVTGNGDDL